MSFKYYRIHHQKHCCLIFWPLLLIVVIAIMVRRAGDLHVAKIPAVTDAHVQRAFDMQDTDENIHVLVIGAGAAGLSAAYTCEYLGLPYTVLEASLNIGGRVREMADFVSVPLDLGAEWIHVMPRVLQDLLLFQGDDATSIDILDYQPRSNRVYARSKNRRRNWFSHFYQEYKFASTTWWSYWANYFYPHVADHVKFDAVVNRIQYNSGGGTTTSIEKLSALTKMTVTTTDGRIFTGSHVIVSVPTRILQDRDITFVPDLQPKTWKAIDDIEMADGIKVWFEFGHDFYPDMQFTKSILKGIESQPMYFDAVWGKSSTDAHVLCLFNVNTKEASQQASWSDQEIVNNALDQLETIFDRSDLRDHLLQSRVQNWSREPYIRGAYTWNHGDYDQEALWQPFHEGHLFLAGEHLASGHESIGTVHGAAITGRQAVLRLLSSTGASR